MKSNEYIALVDCNNFYVSCERVFAPHLKGKAVVVLSNNDGCIVSRSQEAKKLGIPMGAPFFKWKHLMEANAVQVFSSNYALYADMSMRVMKALAHFTPEIEVYSIDEAFLVLSGSEESILEQAHQIRETIFRWTSIPVSVGIAKTKTLAKLASELVKKDASLNGSKLLVSEAEIKDVLKDFPVGSIWGIGRKTSAFLASRGIDTAAQMLAKDDLWIRQNLKITGLRLAHELRGLPCHELETEPEPKKGIVSSRSFGRPVSGLSELEEAVATYTARAAGKLREQNSVARFVHVYITTNRFKPTDEQYKNYAVLQMPEATDYTPELVKHAKAALKDIYRKGFEYKKLGVMLSDICPKEQAQVSLFENTNREKRNKLNELMDSMKKEFGFKALKYASEGGVQDWKMKSDKKSQEFTTRWEDLLEVH